MKLTNKKRLFINGLLRGLYPNASAKQAGYGYPRQSARHLMQDKQVRFYIEKHGVCCLGDNAFQIPEIKLRPTISTNGDPLQVLMAVMNNPDFDTLTRVEVAAYLMPFFHSRKPSIKASTSI